jgi:misacylated tRNA(Ala) deacylase
LYLKDSYLKECDASVTSVNEGKYVVLDRTIFHPTGGGQPHDTGEIVKDGTVYNVVYVGEFSGELSHEVDRPGLTEGERVRCVLNWQRRYKLMRSHTAAHVFASLLCEGTGALITGNQINVEKTRFDFSLEDYDRALIERYIEKANRLFSTAIAVTWYELPREEALQIPGCVKMADAFPPDVPTLRIVEITGVDKQADGGTHVRALGEVGQITLLKTENKGRKNRRVYFSIS